MYTKTYLIIRIFFEGGPIVVVLAGRVVVAVTVALNGTELNLFCVAVLLLRVCVCVGSSDWAYFLCLILLLFACVYASGWQTFEDEANDCCH
jgi:hypothetical protein